MSDEPMNFADDTDRIERATDAISELLGENAALRNRVRELEWLAMFSRAVVFGLFGACLFLFLRR